MSHRRLISERDVRRASSEGAKALDVAGAVVTPSARDLAARLAVALTGGAEPTPRGDARAGARPGQRAAERRPAERPPRGGAPRAQATPATAPAADPKPAPATAASPAKPAVAVGADHGGVAMKDAVAAHLRSAGYVVTDMGSTGTAAVDYPDFAAAVAREVAAGRARFGVMVDGAGIGSAMAANKVAGARAAMCYDVTTATNAREHNDANVLTLGAGLIGPRLALAIVDTFLAVPYAGGRHQARVDKVNALDRR